MFGVEADEDEGAAGAAAEVDDVTTGVAAREGVLRAMISNSQRLLL
jgi:hypothetical protein